MDSGDEKALHESLKQYEQQLEAVELALSSNTSASQAADLLELKQNLEEVISLTKATLRGVVDEDSSTHQEQVHDDTGIDEEFARFQAEMASLGASSEHQDQAATAVEDHSKELAELVDHLEGSKVRAPFSKDWGQMSYHSAIVLSVDASDITHVDDIKVNVMFTHPTVSAMKPCSFFLEGRCKFSQERCRFSHGHAVALSELREYSEPSFSTFKPGSPCLVKSDIDGLWQLAALESIGQRQDEVMVCLSHSGKTVSIGVEDVFPLEGNREVESSDSDGDSQPAADAVPITGGCDDEQEGVPVVAWSPSTASGLPLGAWEKHTKGIGSKLMEKMGYVWGQGLGIRGNGRTEPVEAVVLPAGKSLDKCMELKELGMTQDSAKVQRKMLLKMKREEEKIERRYHKAAQPESVFDFLNGQIFSKKDSKNAGEQYNIQKEANSSQDLKSVSMRGLGIEALQVTEAIKRAEREIVRLGHSSARNKDRDKVMHAQVEKKIEEQRQLIRQLQSKERSIAAEQQHRKGNDKLRIF
ncbi:zinc finger CCCH-type with G patch domain-containing protein isoform X1 [Dermacentor andersoni]|uniref:zinc finger CCCH-type with G patch domain-containing protein isoform X1 n=1 Tax=Dermacentor andersoni TaxID=34620 RepID=UPI00215532A2|nr:zinc finger CCCH-type with G patch domain-containing protein-like isoform X1 [Dermacentor andersoni]